MKLLKNFDAVPDGEIYPRTFPAGEECPSELLPQAIALGLVDEAEAAKSAAEEEEARAKAEAEAAEAVKKAAETKAAKPAENK